MAKIKKFTTGNKYIDLFNEHCKDKSNIDEVIKGIAVINATLVATIAHKDPTELDDVKESVMKAYEHINEFIDTKKKKKRVEEHWFGNNPLLFRMAWAFEDEAFDKTFENLPDHKQEIVQNIVDNIWKLRVYREISVVYGERAIELVIPKTVKKQDLEALYEEFRNTIATAFVDDGAIVVNYGEKNGARTVCGFFSDVDGVALLTADEIEDCYCTAPDGSHFEAPDNYTFIDWPFFNLAFDEN